MCVVLQALLLVLLDLPVQLSEAWGRAADARLAARLKTLRDAGDPTTLAELAKLYPDPGPGKNAAPLLKAAFKLMDDVRLDRDFVLGLPLVGAGTFDAEEDLAPARLADVRLYLAENAEALRLLHEAAALDDCKFDLDFAQGLALPLPHLATMRPVTRLLALEAVERTERGKADEAADSLWAALRLVHTLRREPILVSGLVRIGCDAATLGQLQRLVSRASPSAPALLRLEGALRAEADPKMMEHVFLGERCFGMDSYKTQLLKAGPGGLAALGAPLPPLLIRAVPTAYFKEDMGYYMDLMSEYVVALRKPHPQGLQEAARVGREMERKVPKCFATCRMLLPALGRTCVEAQRHMARLDAARVALAALRYKAQHRRLPGKLSDLVPQFVEAVPPDPFDGHPLRYRIEAGGFVIYAIGDNGRDDGGLIDPDAQGNLSDVGFRLRWPKTRF